MENLDRAKMNSDGLKPGSIDILIEADIDAYGLQHTLQRLELICAEKAAHLITNWNDAGLAAKWNAFATRIQKLSQKAGVELP